jgi:radical SAM superfamily enzyme YgiQ (UPF0313 family)
VRVIFINPPLDSVLGREKINPVTAFLFYNSAPLGILYLAAVLERRGDVVQAIDAAAEGLTAAETVARIRTFRPDLIGITSTTVGFEGAKLLASTLKSALPRIPVVLGGPHVSLLPNEAMATQAFDYGVVGEGDETIGELCEVIEGQRPIDKVLGLVFRRDGQLVFNPSRPWVQELDKLPFPARHLLSPDLYTPVPIDQHGLPKFSIISSRGCPHSCAFCQKANSGYRSFSTRYIVDEMEHLVEDFGAKDIAFVDSLFAHSRRRVEAICDEILARPRLAGKVSWTCSSRVECVDKPLLLKMKKAGCWRTRFGIESGNDDVLKFIRKGINKEQIRNAITWAAEAGLQPKAFFMVGHLPDSHETIRETIEFAKSIPLMDVTVQINTILPKTPQEEIWNREGEKYGKLVVESTDDKSFWQPTYIPHGLTPDDLVYYHRKFYREFYFRPITLWRHMQGIRSADDVMKYLKAARLFAFLFFDKKLPEWTEARSQVEA